MPVTFTCPADGCGSDTWHVLGDPHPSQGALVQQIRCAECGHTEEV